MPLEKTFDAAKAEPRLSAAWEAAGCFTAGANAKPGAAAFSVMIPPPNVTGALHMGHAFNNTLQDILVRWHRMRGFDTLWQPGTDHAGIATQMVVERELAKTNRRRTDMPRDEFIDLVWQQKKKSRSNIRGQLERLGASCDWSREAFTMAGAPGDPGDTPGGQNFHDAVIKVFVDFYNRGIIYRGKRLVNWDPHFETAISDLEVENVENPGFMWHFKYPLAGGQTYEYVEKDDDGVEVLRETRDYISIATTRPETMLGDGAVAVHPSDARYAPIVGKLCEIPVGPKEHRRLIPIITDPYPDPDFGSGAVKITGAHDFNDYEVAKRGGIPMYRLLDTKGALRNDGAPYAEAATRAGEIAGGADFTEAEIEGLNLVPDHLRGLDRFEARIKVVDEITAEGLAVMVPQTDPRLGQAKSQPKAAKVAPSSSGSTRGSPAAKDPRVEPEDDASDTDALVPLVEAKPIMQPMGDRSKVIIEPMLTDQWFVDTQKIVGPAIDAVRDGTVQILPEGDKKVYFHWLENIEPWCISRQLWWGHQVPVWYGPEKPSNLGEELSRYRQIISEHPEAGDQTHPDHAASVKSISAKLTGVLDLGGLVPFCAPTFEQALKLASEYYGEGFDFREWTEEKFKGSRANDGPYLVLRGMRGNVLIALGRDPDVLDTWFSSGLWPLGTLGWPDETDALKRYFPTSTLITGFDIIFFWVARMMMMQTAVLPEDQPLDQRIPFRDVYVHALVRDEKGKKMSKSVGNVIDPLDLIDEYGADAVRFTLTAMAAMGRDLKLSKDRVAGYRNFGTKLWNAFRFAEMNAAKTYISPPESSKLVQFRPEQAVNKWIMGEVARCRDEVDTALAAYRFNDAANALYAFVWGTVCDWYLELSKPLFSSEDTDITEETKATLAWTLDQCLILLHPIMPFITEELWGDRPEMLALTDWPVYQTSDLVDEKSDAETSWVIALIEQIRSVRGEMGVPAGAKIPLIQLELDDIGKDIWGRNSAIIQRLARISSLEETAAAPKGAVTLPVRGGTFALPLAGIIDVDAEKSRLDKALGKIDKDLGGLNGRLNNPKFLASAPPDVIAETKALVAEKTEEKERLATAQARLAQMA